jgi:hypothetical protein
MNTIIKANTRISCILSMPNLKKLNGLTFFN